MTDNKRLRGNSHVIYDIIYLDDLNKIIVYKNINNFTMIHYRKINGELKEIKKWNVDKYHKTVNSDFIKREYNLFLVQGGNTYNCTDAIYNYKEAKFIIEKGMFDIISSKNFLSGRNSVDYLKKYGCFLACFKLYSNKEDSDIIKYTNNITLEEIKIDFSKSSDMYFAFINPDGKIRDNKLFYGSNLSSVTEPIDLNKYNSLDEFKLEIINKLNEEKNKEKENYFNIINKKEKVNLSPYLDEEIEKVLKLK